MYDNEDVGELERLEELQVASRRAAEIITDSIDAGPLHKFLQASKKRAEIAMDKFAYMDLLDQSNLVELQVQVRSYIDLLQWMESRLEGGRMADQYINEEFGDEETDA